MLLGTFAFVMLILLGYFLWSPAPRRTHPYRHLCTRYYDGQVDDDDEDGDLIEGATNGGKVTKQLATGGLAMGTTIESGTKSAIQQPGKAIQEKRVQQRAAAAQQRAAAASTPKVKKEHYLVEGLDNPKKKQVTFLRVGKPVK